MPDKPGHITQLLQAISDESQVPQPSPSADELLALVYDQLRRIAQQRMQEERAGHTLQATALVHEAWLRLVGDADVRWAGRAHFYAAAAEAMRRILIERARRRAGPRQGGHLRRIDLEQASVVQDGNAEDLIVLDDALSQLEKHDAQAAGLVKLRYFAGLSHQEAAEVLGVGRRRADRLWALARAWLYQQFVDR
jgi:RNA polymerase sigma factor (TIGR02999 family)